MNHHVRSIQGRLEDAEAAIEEHLDTISHLNAVIAAYESQFARIQRALDAAREDARPRIAKERAS
jgi:uncharacterized coiled-coil protein SlyX